MSTDPDPVVLELAPLPREQVGPFLLLGVSKAADQEEIEANWAQRVIWARKKAVRVPLEDVNWSREVINDFERRARADATSLNVDTANGVLQHLQQRYGGQERPPWQPLDQEKLLANYQPPTEIPDLEAVKNAIRVPDIPQEVPVVGKILENYLREPLDPWKLTLAAVPDKGTAP